MNTPSRLERMSHAAHNRANANAAERLAQLTIQAAGGEIDESLTDALQMPHA